MKPSTKPRSDSPLALLVPTTSKSTRHTLRGLDLLPRLESDWWPSWSQYWRFARNASRSRASDEQSRLSASAGSNATRPLGSCRWCDPRGVTRHFTFETKVRIGVARPYNCSIAVNLSPQVSFLRGPAPVHRPRTEPRRKHLPSAQPCTRGGEGILQLRLAPAGSDEGRPQAARARHKRDLAEARLPV